MPSEPSFPVRYRRPIALVAASVLVDMAIRLGSGFDMSVVVPWEAGLFAVGAASFVWAHRLESDPGARRTDLWLAALYVLAAVRSTLWSAGVEVATANLVVFAVAVLTGGWLLWRRRTRRNA